MEAYMIGRAACLFGTIALAAGAAALADPPAASSASSAAAL